MHTFGAKRQKRLPISDGETRPRIFGDYLTNTGGRAHEKKQRGAAAAKSSEKKEPRGTAPAMERPHKNGSAMLAGVAAADGTRSANG